MADSDITVTISRWDRLWVADALRDAARAERDMFQGRRAKTMAGRSANERALRLWTLAQQIDSD